MYSFIPLHFVLALAQMCKPVNQCADTHTHSFITAIYSFTVMHLGLIPRIKKILFYTFCSARQTHIYAFNIKICYLTACFYLQSHTKHWSWRFNNTFTFNLEAPFKTPKVYELRRAWRTHILIGRLVQRTSYILDFLHSIYSAPISNGSSTALINKSSQFKMVPIIWGHLVIVVYCCGKRNSSM